jgi:hypothetical protein
LLNISACEIARNRTNKSAETDEKDVNHSNW